MYFNTRSFYLPILSERIHESIPEMPLKSVAVKMGKKRSEHGRARESHTCLYTRRKSYLGPFLNFTLTCCLIRVRLKKCPEDDNTSVHFTLHLIIYINASFSPCNCSVLCFLRLSPHGGCSLVFIKCDSLTINT